MNIRRARIEDLPGMQACNLRKLLHEIFYVAILPFISLAGTQTAVTSTSLDLYHCATWPSISYVAEDKGRIVGYILAKMEEETAEAEQPHGHVTSISVLRSYRRLGIAKKLMLLSQESMASHRASHVALHVRKSNRAALSLYRDTLGFEVHDIEQKYYADGEDAYAMRLTLKHD
ncbi:acyl-CoA N-acyltransferase [Lentinula edodes]|nr:acyl-CoA N-acyltransferase [Lentinula edodes]